MNASHVLRPLSRLSCLLGATLLPVPVRAQAPQNLFEIYPEAAGVSTTFATRNGLPAANDGEVLQEVPGRSFVGIGENGAGCTVSGLRFLLQDQDGSSPELYRPVLRAAAATNGPPGAELVTLAPVQTPVAAAGPVAWEITVTFATPVSVPCTGGLFMGASLATNAAWPADGLALHGASYAWPGAPFPNVGDQPRATAPVLGWYGIAGGAFSRAANGRVVRVGLLTEAAVFHVGNFRPGSTRTPDGISWGAGGTYPLPTDGNRGRVLDRINAGGFAFCFTCYLGTTRIPIPGISGALYLTPPIVMLSNPAPLDGNGRGEGIIAPPGGLAGLVGTGGLAFQCVTLDPGFTRIRFTNGAGIEL